MNQYDVLIYVECNNDVFFVKKIGFRIFNNNSSLGRKNIKHSKGKMNIFKAFSQQRNHGVVHIGFIDEDPHAVRVKELDEKYERIDILENGGLTLYKQRNNNYYYLIEISPDLEHWLVKRFQESGIQNRLEENNPDDLAKWLHEIKIENNAKATRMINELMNSRNRGIEKIREWIQTILG